MGSLDRAAGSGSHNARPQRRRTCHRALSFGGGGVRAVALLHILCRRYRHHHFLVPDTRCSLPAATARARVWEQDRSTRGTVANLKEVALLPNGRRNNGNQGPDGNDGVWRRRTSTLIGSSGQRSGARGMKGMGP
jgi:hypothetical protein